METNTTSAQMHAAIDELAERTFPGVRAIGMAIGLVLKYEGRAGGYIYAINSFASICQGWEALGYKYDATLVGIREWKISALGVERLHKAVDKAARQAESNARMAAMQAEAAAAEAAAKSRFCCADMAHAHDPATDSEGYSTALHVLHGETLISSELPALRFCPWCGAKMTKEA